MKYKTFKLFGLMLVNYCLFLGIYFAMTYHQYLLVHCDNWAQIIAQNIQSTNLTRLFTAISQLASQTGLTLLTLLVIAWFSYYKRYHVAALLAINMTVLTYVNHLLKNSIQRPRPSLQQLLPIGGYSFPSGHTYGITVLLITLLLISLQKAPIKPFKLLFVCSIILLVAISRIYLQVHYLSDVLAGFSLGTANTILSFLIYQFLNKKVVVN